jgi:hypothetical protein
VVFRGLRMVQVGGASYTSPSCNVSLDVGLAVARPSNVLSLNGLPSCLKVWQGPRPGPGNRSTILNLSPCLNILSGSRIANLSPCLRALNYERVTLFRGSHAVGRGLAFSVNQKPAFGLWEHGLWGQVHCACA